MINSLDTAVVMVEGEIPAGAIKQRRFDVRITAVDEETRSLAGGVLLQTELKVFQSVSPAAVIEGRTLANAGGQVFMNPFREATASAPASSLREGMVIAGGTVIEDRKLTLSTASESYATVRQVQDAINARFKAEPPIAVAENSKQITLHVPQDYRGREGRFLELVMHLPLSSSVAELEARAKIMAAELTQPDANHRELALSLEGIGKPALEFVRPLYANPNKSINFAAAAVGVRVGDPAALDIIIRHANDPRSSFRFQAIRELGECQQQRRAAAALQALLDGNDPPVRVLAYESLRTVDRAAVAQTIIGERPENFILEMVASRGKPMIYARRTKAPRIALIGSERMECRPPILYASPDAPVTLTAKRGDKLVAIIKRDPARNLGPYYTPLAVPVLTRFLGDDMRVNADGKLFGLKLSYGSVIAVLHHLCTTGAINADFRSEEQAPDELLGPLTPMGRPESELQ
jgi:hypothetical protein